LRVRHMDALGVDVQVLHSTIFLMQFVDRAEVEVPLCHAYNRWLAHIWQQGKGRLRWSMVPPLLNIPDAIEQMREAKQNGAVGVLMRPLEATRVLVAPYFYPIYEEASRLALTLCVHIACANPAYIDLWRFLIYPGSIFNPFLAPTAGTCHALMMSEIPQV